MSRKGKSVRTITGGLKEFAYSQEDLRRVGSEDTESTAAFKEELQFWREHPYKFWWKHHKKQVIRGAVIMAALVVIFLTLRILKII